jgi:hypothetical protein
MRQKLAFQGLLACIISFTFRYPFSFGFLSLGLSIDEPTI